MSLLHKPWCASNIQCAVYHNNGICPDQKQCNCVGNEQPPKLNPEKLAALLETIINNKPTEGGEMG